MGKEQVGKELQPLSVTIYFGTTLSLFKTCAEVTPEGMIVFTKSLEPTFKFPEIQPFTRTVKEAADWAITRALLHRESPNDISREIPLILEGEIGEGMHTKNDELLPGESFPVTQVWMPKDEVYWQGYNVIKAASDPSRKEFERVFEAKNPHDIMQ